ITASTNLNKNDVERMVKEATENKAEDDRRKKVIEARNQGDSVAYQAEKLLKDMGDKVDAGKRTELESKIRDLRDSIAGDDVSAIERSSESVQKLTQAIGEAAYKQQDANAAKPETSHQQSGPDNNGEDVVEGEFHEA
ncbi:MAG: Hsp70 family protein, partial [Anaerolineaceae bacterium]